MEEPRKKLDLQKIRERLKELTGKEYWRSLDELAGTEEFQEFLHREFPQGASELSSPLTRRSFLKLMAASLGLAGLTACQSRPTGTLVPYVDQPEVLVQGMPLFFATSDVLNGYAVGVLAESHMGRPTKIEGNPAHPDSLGATDVFAQAGVLMLYDPDRSQTVMSAGRIRSWDGFFSVFQLIMDAQRAQDGAGLRILSETVTSPTLADQVSRLLDQFPQARWHQYDPVNRDNANIGALDTFGEFVDTLFMFDQAEVILSLDADFLSAHQSRVRYTRDFSSKRRIRQDQAQMNRLYTVESTISLTGAMADHRLAMPPSQIEIITQALANRLGVEGAQAVELPEDTLEFVETVAADLQQNQGNCIVIAGDGQPPSVHTLVHFLNQTLGNVGRTVIHIEPVVENPILHNESIDQLVQEMQAGQVDVLVILGGNPVYTAPADLDFAGNLAHVGFSVHLSLYQDETSALCHWHLPETHYLETWGDARAYDGTISLIQPLIEPLYAGRSANELLSGMLGEPGKEAYDIVREFWQRQVSEEEFEAFWRTAVHDGMIAGSARPGIEVSINRAQLANLLENQLPHRETAPNLAILFRPDPTIRDGRFANNGWLQELPKPLTKLTWDNAAMVSPETAQRLELTNEDLVTLEFQGHTVEAPIWVAPGHADDCVTVHLGYGRWRAGRVGTGAGFNAYRLRTSDNPWFGSGLEIHRLNRRYQLATTQLHFNMEGRDHVRWAPIDQFIQNPSFPLQEHDLHPQPSLYPEFEYRDHAWGMVIDLNACTGCGACVIACQAENNIPIVGKEEVARGREMHWIRVDHYYHGDMDEPQVFHQPVTCMHCEKAPCEVVCPVAATVHSDEGLNEMIYSRCVGTRYCSHNCPYKVRRFNFLQYADLETGSLRLLNNPNVTVRNRGVMEKCTYCVQRINAARRQAKIEGRRIKDGEVVTACQAACPAQAIIFGDINDPDSQVAQAKRQPHDYGLLTELNTQPRTTYLAKLTNPNPEIEGKS
jgi:MoCo/4Fe-4S cofactor protein with predicted Tat translocation signal